MRAKFGFRASSFKAAQIQLRAFFPVGTLPSVLLKSMALFPQPPALRLPMALFPQPPALHANQALFPQPPTLRFSGVDLAAAYPALIRRSSGSRLPCQATGVLLAVATPALKLAFFRQSPSLPGYWRCFGSRHPCRLPRPTGFADGAGLIRPTGSTDGAGSS